VGHIVPIKVNTAGS